MAAYRRAASSLCRSGFLLPGGLDTLKSSILLSGVAAIALLAATAVPTVAPPVWEFEAVYIMNSDGSVLAHSLVGAVVFVVTCTSGWTESSSTSASTFDPRWIETTRGDSLARTIQTVHQKNNIVETRTYDCASGSRDGVTEPQGGENDCGDGGFNQAPNVNQRSWACTMPPLPVTINHYWKRGNPITGVGTPYTGAIRAKLMQEPFYEQHCISHKKSGLFVYGVLHVQITNENLPCTGGYDPNGWTLLRDQGWAEGVASGLGLSPDPTPAYGSWGSYWDFT